MAKRNFDHGTRKTSAPSEDAWAKIKQDAAKPVPTNKDSEA
jgi:hypothetical protein